MGKMLSICPVVHFTHEGEVCALQSVRTQKKAIYRKLGVSKDTELMAAMVCEHKGMTFTLKALREKGVTLYD